jgi:hypothetical protein
MINRLSSSIQVLAIGGLLFAGSAIAQTATTSGAGQTVEPGNARAGQANSQQHRAAKSVKAPKQTSNPEKQAEVQNRGQQYMAAHNAHLTKAEQTGTNKQEDQITPTVYTDQHN